jgi:hypothetical protein
MEVTAGEGMDLIDQNEVMSDPFSCSRAAIRSSDLTCLSSSLWLAATLS